MKLAILCAYRLSAADEPLLETHLGQIERLTEVPYTLYAAPVDVPEEFRERLAAAPRAVLVDCSPTELTLKAEHAHYLEQLTRLAIEDGATHVVTLHPDSFPIRAGWATALAGILGDDLPLATTPRPNTFCFLFTREFYLAHQPRFLLTEEQLASPLGQAMVAERRVIPHSGSGFLYSILEAGLSWFALDTQRPTDTGFPSDEVAGGMVYHLGGLLFHTQRSVKTADAPAKSGSRLASMALALRPLVPQDVRARLKPALRHVGLGSLEAERAADVRAEFQRAFDAFAHHPERLLQLLRAYTADLPNGEPRSRPEALS